MLRQNLPLLGENEDYWVTQRVTRGVETPDGDVPTVLIECRPLPLAARARYYRTGVPMVTPSVPRTPPQFLSPRAKTHNYLNMVMGDLEARDRNPDAWALLLDERGNLAEGKGLQRLHCEGRGDTHAERAVRVAGDHARCGA